MSENVSRIISRAEPLMGTTITIQVHKTTDVSTVLANDAIENGLAEFRRIVKLYTRFADDSQLSDLNRRGGEWVEVSPEFFMLISQMVEMSRQTNGAFDPTIIDFLEIYGYDKNYDFSKLDNPTLDKMVQDTADTRPSWQDIEFDQQNLKVKLVKGQRLDLGGIGKGYAIDCASKHLQKTHNFLIDGGGDLYGQGLNLQGEPWLVDLKHKDGVIGQLRLKEEGEALACSGTWARKIKQFHHLINPTSGQSDARFDTVFVLAADATTADTWGTALAVGGAILAKDLPTGIEFLAIDKENKVLGTKGFRDRMQVN